MQDDEHLATSRRSGPLETDTRAPDKWKTSGSMPGATRLSGLRGGHTHTCRTLFIRFTFKPLPGQVSWKAKKGSSMRREIAFTASVCFTTRKLRNSHPLVALRDLCVALVQWPYSPPPPSQPLLRVLLLNG